MWIVYGKRFGEECRRLDYFSRNSSKGKEWWWNIGHSYANDNIVHNNTMEELFIFDQLICTDSLMAFFINQLTPSCEDMLLYCEYGGQEFNCTSSFSTILTDDGFCCIFNGVNRKYLMKTVPKWNEIFFSVSLFNTNRLYTYLMFILFYNHFKEISKNWTTVTFQTIEQKCGHPR